MVISLISTAHESTNDEWEYGEMGQWRHVTEATVYNTIPTQLFDHFDMIEHCAFPFESSACTFTAWDDVFILGMSILVYIAVWKKGALWNS